MARDTLAGEVPGKSQPSKPPQPSRPAGGSSGNAADTADTAAGGAGRVRAPIRAAVALLAGLVMCAAFPPFGLWPLAAVGVALFTLVLRGVSVRAAAGLGLLTGLAFFFTVLEGIRKVGPDGWIALSVFEALYFVPLGVALALATRLRGWPLWAAALWVTEELVRDRVPFGGFPWGRLAFSQTASPLTPYAALGGAPLVTFITALIGTLIAAMAVTALGARRPAAGWRAAVRAASGTVRRPGTALALASVALLCLAGPLVPRAAGGRQLTVAVIQGNVPRLGLDFLGQRQAVLNNHVHQTRRLAALIAQGRVSRPDLVVWPENASDIDPYRDAGARRLIDDAVRAVGAPVLVGAVIVRPDGQHLENRGIVWDPATGAGDYYVKRHPVPFGEYIPVFRDRLRKVITRFERVGEFVPGDGPGLLKAGGVTVGDVICFEVAYDEVVRDVAAAEVLVVQTNNATYGRTTFPPQQVAMSRLRAVEHGRPVLVAATSGISAIIAPDGRALDSSAEFTPDIQVERVRAGTSRTPADRVGAVPEWLLAIVGAGAAATAAYSGIRVRGGDGGRYAKRRRGDDGRERDHR